MTTTSWSSNPKRCIGCGTCATVCPTCALEAHRPNDAELLQARCAAAADVADGQVVIACDQLLAAAGRVVRPREGVGATRLGRVESLLVTLAALGVRRVSLRAGALRAMRACLRFRDGAGCVRHGKRAACNLEQRYASTWRKSFPHPCAGRATRATTRAVGASSSMKDEAKNVAAVTADYAVKDALVWRSGGAEVREGGQGRHAALTSFPTAANVCWPRLDLLGQPQDVPHGHALVGPW